MDNEEVVRLLRAGDWEGAHGIVQDDESTLAAWAHGIVHMLEGDMANAGYWFKRAGRTVPATADAAAAEIEALASEVGLPSA